MKKFILSMSVMLSFGFYVIWQNVGNNIDTVKLLKNPTPNPTPAPIVVRPPNNSMMGGGMMNKGIYNDGQYIGDSVDAYYGYVQVKVVISGGRLTNVVVLDYPQDRGTSVRINSRAMPILRQEAIQAQSANIDAVSGASASSPAFIDSLASALRKAKV